MLNNIIKFSLNNKYLIILASVLLVVIGMRTAINMDVDVAEVDVADADIEITDNERQTMLDLFAEACARHTAWDDIDLRQQGSIVRRLERGCHNSAVHSCEKDRIN